MTSKTWTNIPRRRLKKNEFLTLLSENGMSINDAAKKFEVSKSLIYKWTSGECMCMKWAMDSIVRMSNGKTEDDLFY